MHLYFLSWKQIPLHCHVIILHMHEISQNDALMELVHLVFSSGWQHMMFLNNCVLIVAAIAPLIANEKILSNRVFQYSSNICIQQVWFIEQTIQDFRGLCNSDWIKGCFKISVPSKLWRSKLVYIPIWANVNPTRRGLWNWHRVGGAFKAPPPVKPF